MSKETENQNIDHGQSLDEGANQENNTFSADVKDRPTASGAQGIVIIVVAIALIGGILYYFFGGSSDKKKPKSIDQTIPISQNRPQTADNIPVPQVMSSAPSSQIALQYPVEHKKPLEDEKKAPLPPPPHSEEHNVALPSAPHVVNQKQLQQQKQARMNSSIMLRGGGDGQSSGSKAANDSSKRSVTSDFKPDGTSATNTQVTKVGNLSYFITQGKIIEGVLETPINTNLPGPVRAVVSRDVYSEHGENILVPKGSRLIGTFATGVQAGQARVGIQWNRIIMPNGYDINVQKAPGTGPLGQIGVVGEIHREFFGIVGNAVLLSVLNIALAKEAQKQTGIQTSQTTTTTNTDGSTVTNSTADPVQQSVQQQVQNLGSVTAQWFKENFQVKPFITISQGTVIKVFVNQDIQFPSNIFSGVNHLG